MNRKNISLSLPSSDWSTTRLRRVLGTGIARARKRRGLKQEEVARAVGISKGMLGRYETGLNLPRTLTLLRLLDTLGVTLEDVTSPAEAPPGAGEDLDSSES